MLCPILYLSFVFISGAEIKKTKQTHLLLFLTQPKTAFTQINSRPVCPRWLSLVITEGLLLCLLCETTQDLQKPFTKFSSVRHDVSYAVFTPLSVGILPLQLNASWVFASVIAHHQKNNSFIPDNNIVSKRENPHFHLFLHSVLWMVWSEGQLKK